MDGRTVRIAVAVDGREGLDGQCAATVEAAEHWLIVELSSTMVLAVAEAPNPLAGEGRVADALQALSLDVVLARAAGAAATQAIEAQGITMITGARGTARNTLVDYVIGALCADGRSSDGGEHAH